MIRILIVEDHEVVRDALANLLGDAADMDVIATACTVRDALPLLDQHRPQVVLTDLALEDGSGMELVRALRRSRRKGRVLVLTGHSDVFTAKKTLAEGVAGYVLKSQSSSELLDAIRAVAVGMPYVAPEIAEKLASDGSGANIENLSRREDDVFRQLVSGYGSRAIARNLSISLKTVETHRASINRKLAVTTTADLIRFAVARGMPVVPRISSDRARSN
jgi:DNA-binding NarL/FixJ family response regulator